MYAKGTTKVLEMGHPNPEGASPHKMIKTHRALTAVGGILLSIVETHRPSARHNRACI